MGTFQLTPREELEKAQAHFRRRRRAIIFTSIGVFALLVVFLVLFELTDVIVRLSPDIESTSLDGNWALFHHDLARTGSTGAAGVLPAGSIAWTSPISPAETWRARTCPAARAA